MWSRYLPPHTGPWSATVVSCCESGQNLAEVDLVDCVWSLNILKVNETLAVKKHDDHHFGSSYPFPWLLRSGFTLPQPGERLVFEVGIVHIYPRLVYSDDVVEGAWGVEHQSCPKITNVHAKALVPLSEIIGYKLCTFLLKVEVKLEHRSELYSSLGADLMDSYSPVFCHQIFNAPDVGP